MGMDVMGHDPKSDVGEYFRNNVWWWRPLWSWVCSEFPDLVGDDPEMGFFNDGYGLDSESSAELAQAMMEAVKDGRAKKFESEFNLQKSELPLEDCTWCNSTGIRTDDVGVDLGMPDRELDEATAIIVGRTHGWCNSCDGHGKQESFLAHYYFEVENVVEFAEFLKNCGGFGIH